MDRQEGRDKAFDIAKQALELDPNLSEAHTVLGGIYTFLDWDWEKAEDEYQTALVLNPNYSTAHQYYAEHLAIVGRHEEARMHIDKAVELDPLSFVIRVVNARLYYNQGQFEESLQELEKCDEIQENHPWANKLLVYYQLGREEKAFEAFKENQAVNPRYDLEIADQIYQDSGFRAVLQWMVECDIARPEEEQNYYWIASFLALLGKDEEALDWLEKAYQVHAGNRIKTDYSFRNLHDRPRFQAILKGMGLEK
jgi:tetratricopeptide (TPR) repeat protein